MKRHGNLFEKIVSPENLMLAYQRAIRGKNHKIINKEVEVIGYSIRRSRYEKNKSGKCLLLQMNLDGAHRVLFSGSDVLIEQMEKYGSHIPFLTMIKKIDRFYTLS